MSGDRTANRVQFEVALTLHVAADARQASHVRGQPSAGPMRLSAFRPTQPTPTVTMVESHARVHSLCLLYILRSPCCLQSFSSCSLSPPFV